MGKVYILEERFYSTDGRLIQRMATPDLYEEAQAIARAKMLTSTHGPKKCYTARLATDDELLECWEVAENRQANASQWRKVG